jgi:hypothetical protein
MRGCLLSAKLDETLNAEQQNEVLDKVRKIKGVISAAFHDAAKPNGVISIHAGSGAVCDEIKKIPGVKSTKLDPRRMM